LLHSFLHLWKALISQCLLMIHRTDFPLTNLVKTARTIVYRNCARVRLFHAMVSHYPLLIETDSVDRDPRRVARSRSPDRRAEIPRQSDGRPFKPARRPRRSAKNPEGIFKELRYYCFSTESENKAVKKFCSRMKVCIWHVT